MRLCRLIFLFLSRHILRSLGKSIVFRTAVLIEGFSYETNQRFRDLWAGVDLEFSHLKFVRANPCCQWRGYSYNPRICRH
ncbi:hypothetical protein C8J55DRAFT_502511 [Lentinula edodes]|uniref:Secreted protein n=1 Tax=Lentinula lateritia TaxID=40482 RepID=A0A9W9AW05_9AGAR|nr:hypothetical protein C8J55DRAFT_502511 [Lentinula edodes]